MVKHKFILGEEWLYYKIYCGRKTADLILINSIASLVSSLESDNLICNWFYIRYSDPEPHLRVRFKRTKKDHLSHIIERFEHMIRPYLDNKLVWKLSCNTYQRELSRYGDFTIDIAENIFNCDSENCLTTIAIAKDDTQLFFYTIFWINKYLDAFEFNLTQKINFTERNRNAFRGEFTIGKSQLKVFARNYQLLKDPFLEVMDRDIPNFRETEAKLESLLQLLRKNIGKNKKQVLPENIMSSIIHMCVNRRFRDKQRFHELLCYEFIWRYYQLKKHKVVAN